MSNNKITLKGFKELRGTLEELGIDFKSVVKKASLSEGRRIAKEANNEAKARGWSENKYYIAKETRINKKSDTESNIKITTISKRLKGDILTKNKIKAYKEVGDRYYAFFPEYGTIRQKAQPLLIPIFESNKDRIEEYIEGEINKIINEKTNK